MTRLSRWLSPRVVKHSTVGDSIHSTAKQPTVTDSQEKDLHVAITGDDYQLDRSTVSPDRRDVPFIRKGKLIVTRSQRAAAAGHLNNFPVPSRELYARVADAPESQWSLLLNELSDRDLHEIQRMVGTAAHTDWPLRQAVSDAVLRRPHRGRWPLDL